MLYFYKGPYDYRWTEICEEEWRMWAKTLEGDKRSGCRTMTQAGPTEEQIQYAEGEGFSYDGVKFFKFNWPNRVSASSTEKTLASLADKYAKAVIEPHPDSGWQCNVFDPVNEEDFGKQIHTLKQAILEAKSQFMLLDASSTDSARQLVDQSKPRVYRAWINQPSTLQPLHKLHGKRCIAVDYGEGPVTLHFTEGDTHSMVAQRLCISEFKI